MGGVLFTAATQWPGDAEEEEGTGSEEVEARGEKRLVRGTESGVEGFRRVEAQRVALVRELEEGGVDITAGAAVEEELVGEEGCTTA